MSSKIAFVFLLGATATHAQTAAQVCAQIPYADHKVACVRAITGHQVAPEAAAVCGSIPYADKVVQCLSGALDKTYDQGALAACNSIPYADQKAECVAAAGSVRRARRDDDEPRPAEEATGTVTIENRSTRVVFERVYWRNRKGQWAEHPNRRAIRASSERSYEMYLGRYDFCVQATDGRSAMWRRIEVSEGDARLAVSGRDLENIECLDR